MVPILTVVGGSDIAEPFNISSEVEAQRGMVVSIDPARTGELRVCTQAYDSAVAGIVSGAGGVKTGMTLKQDGTAWLIERADQLAHRRGLRTNDQWLSLWILPHPLLISP